MPAQQSNHNSQSFHKQKIGKTILNDIKQGNFKRTFTQDLKDIYHFYFDEDTKDRLSQMNRVKRGLVIVWWMLKSMFMKLTPARRILFVASIIMVCSIQTTTDNGDAQLSLHWLMLGVTLLILILMLELKDKWLATDELMIGRKVQFSLLPDENPNIDGWEVWMYTQPANEVGGDLVDSLEYCDKRWGLALGDVAGKGLGAALFMAKLQATYRALAPNTDSLDKLGREMNIIFRRDGIPNRFISFVYLLISNRSNTIKLLNAGHFPPLLMRGSQITELPNGGPAFGIMNDAEYKEQSITLESGDVLVTFSDGLTEACNERGDFFGEDRLKIKLAKAAGFPAALIGSHLLDDVKQFVGNARAHDDLSLVILRYLG